MAFKKGLTEEYGVCYNVYCMPYKNKEKRLEAAREHRRGNPKQYAIKQAAYYDNNLDMYLLLVAKTRAKRTGVSFSLSREDVKVPTHCPVFGTLLARGTRGFHESSPSLDRVKPELGYVKGNVVVVSFKANRMKQNATVDELEKLASFYRKLEEEAGAAPPTQVVVMS